jgi:hypothetical protein
MLNVLQDKSNGEAKDKAWSWKQEPNESGQVKRELSDFDEGSNRARL